MNSVQPSFRLIYGLENTPVIGRNYRYAPGRKVRHNALALAENSEY